MFCSCKL